MQGVLTGVKPAAVGMIGAAAVTIAGEILLQEGYLWPDIFQNPLMALSPLSVVIFAATAFLSIRHKMNPILLTVCAGVLGAFLL